MVPTGDAPLKGRPARQLHFLPGHLPVFKCEAS